MRDIFVTLIVFSTIPFILARPYIGILVWSWIGYMNPHRLAWGFAYNFPFAFVIALAIFAGLFFSKEPKRIPWTRESIILLAFALWMFVTTIFAQYPWLAWAHWDKVWKIQLMVFITLMVMENRERLNLLIWAIVLSVGFYGIKGGIFTIATGGEYRVLGPPQSFIGTRGEIALAMNMTFPLMRYLQLQSRQIWIRHGLTIAMILTAFAIIGTHSRGGFLGFLAISVFLILKTRKRIRYGMLIVLTATAVFSFMPGAWIDRMETLQTYEADASAMGRIDSWEFAVQKALEHPLTGGGFQIFAGRTDSHSIWFGVLGEHGFIGLGLFLMLIIMTWRTSSWIIRNAKRQEEIRWMADLAGMVQVSMVAYFVGGSFLGLQYFDLYYHLIAIIILCKVMLLNYLSERQQQVKADVVHSMNPIGYTSQIIVKR